MKGLYTLPILMFLTIAMMAGCSGTSHSTKEQAATEDLAFKARRQLTFEQQREFDKIYLEAICQKLKGNYDAAYELLWAAYDINPLASEVLYELGLAHLNNSTASEAPLSALSTKEDSLWVEQGDDMLAFAVDFEPSNPYFRETLAQRYINTGRYEEAVPLYEKITAEKADPQNLMLLSRLYSVNGDYDNAVKTMERIEQIEGYSQELAFAIYSISRASGKIKESIKYIERLADENPQELSYRVTLGDVYLHDGLFDEAREAYDKVLSTDPDNALAKISYTQYYELKEDAEGFNRTMSEIMKNAKVPYAQKANALEFYAGKLLQNNSIAKKDGILTTDDIYLHYCEALTLPTEDNSLSESFLDFCQQSRQPAEKLQLACETILDAEPDNTRARLVLLQQYVRQQDTQRIIALCHEGTKQSPEQLAFYYYEAMSLLQISKLDEAIAVFERATMVINEDSDADVASEIYGSLGDMYHEAKKVEQAYDAYENALKYNPDNTGCLNNYAYFLALEGRQLDKALEMSKKTVDAEPNNPTFLDTYAWALYCKGQYTQARIYIDQTIKNLPADEQEAASSAGLYDHAGDIYYKIGEKSSALEYWRHAMRLSDDTDLTKKLNNKIKNKKP